MRHVSIAMALAASAGVAASASAQVDFNLGNIAAPVVNLVGTTAGATNDIDTYAPIGNPAAIWDQDIIYEFTISAPRVVSMTSNDPNGAVDNDFFMLSSLSTTINSSNLREASVVATQTVLNEVNGSFGLLNAGTYYFVIDAWRGNPTVGGTPPQGRAGAYNVNLAFGLPPTPPVTFATGEHTAADPSFLRPNGAGTAISTTNARYDLVPFYVTATGSYTINQTGSPFDDFLAIYSPSFDPSAGLANLVEADDDDGAGTDSQITRVFQEGVQYFAVVTAFSSGSLGAWQLTAVGFEGGTVVAGLVPTPGVGAVLALAGLAGARRRRAA